MESKNPNNRGNRKNKKSPLIFYFSYTGYNNSFSVFMIAGISYGLAK